MNSIVIGDMHVDYPGIGDITLLNYNILMQVIKNTGLIYVKYEFTMIELRRSCWHM